jgi:hypothetical protein
MGKRAEVTKALAEAIKHLPLVAEELLKTKHRRPKTVMPGYITYGGADQAYEYWATSVRFWMQTPEALAWLQETLTSQLPRKRRA